MVIYFREKIEMLISEEEKLREHGIRVKVVGKVFIMFCVFYSRKFHRTVLH